jgi:hypothetical protein
VRTLRTMTRDLEALRDWLQELGVTQVGTESTGVCWRPIYAVLEGHFDLIVGNARHIRNVPGRRTDVKGPARRQWRHRRAWCRRSHGCREHRQPMQRDGRPEKDAYIDTDLGDEGGGDRPFDQQGVLNAVTCELCFDAVECGDILLGRFETAQLCRQ